ncbi:MAG: HAD family phosphatase [Bythopirellula sp.]|nr:HAD family phosphatase [Bythopirellula sp.]
MNDYPPSTMPLRAVVFDLDGLMFNTEELYQEVGSTVLARRGCSFTPELLNEMMGRQSAKALQIMIEWNNLTDTVEELASESMQVMHGLLGTRLSPMPGLLDLLAALEQANIPKAIATSSGREFLDAVLVQSGLAGRFAFTIAGSEIEHGKPAPDIYLLAAKKHGCLPQEVLVLEDSQIGCRAAVAANTYAVAVPSGHSHTHEFPGARFVADTLSDEWIYRVLGMKPLL